MDLSVREMKPNHVRRTCKQRRFAVLLASQWSEPLGCVRWRVPFDVQTSVGHSL